MGWVYFCRRRCTDEFCVCPIEDMVPCYVPDDTDEIIDEPVLLQLDLPQDDWDME